MTNESRRSDIWSKLTIPALAVSLYANVNYFFGDIVNIGDSWTVSLLVSTTFVSCQIYFVIFVLWHWHTRYIGEHSFRWCVFFVVFFFTLSTVIYFVLHVIPDMLGAGRYASTESAPQDAPREMPHRIPQAFCFVCGWAFLLFGLLLALVQITLLVLLTNIFERGLPGWMSNGELPNDAADSISSFIAATTIGLSATAGAAVLCAAGGILLFISQRLRWRRIEFEFVANGEE